MLNDRISRNRGSFPTKSAVSHAVLVSGYRVCRTIWETVAYCGYVTGVQSLFPDTQNKVLMYHSVGGGSWDHISETRFRQDVEYLTTEYEVVDLPRVVESSDSKRVALTFDDGLMDFYSTVVPVLHDYNIPATVFIISDAFDEPGFNHDNACNYQYMGSDEIFDLLDDELVTVGNHTKSHPRLSHCSTEELQNEIVVAKERLEKRFGTLMNRFCYPYGDYDQRAAALVRETHDIAVKTPIGNEPITENTSRELIPRLNGASPAWKVKWELTDFASKIHPVPALVRY